MAPTTNTANQDNVWFNLIICFFRFQLNTVLYLNVKGQLTQGKKYMVDSITIKTWRLDDINFYKHGTKNQIIAIILHMSRDIPIEINNTES